MLAQIGTPRHRAALCLLNGKRLEVETESKVFVKSSDKITVSSSPFSLIKLINFDNAVVVDLPSIYACCLSVSFLLSTKNLRIRIANNFSKILEKTDVIVLGSR